MCRENGDEKLEPSNDNHYQNIENELKEYTPSFEQKEQLNLVLEILKGSQEENLNVVVMAGYGLDGLFGQLTRDHGDLDLLVEDEDVESFLKILSNNDWKEDTGEKMKGQGGYEFRHPNLPKSFKVEFGKLSQMKSFMKKEQNIEKYVAKENNAILRGVPFKTFNLEGHKWSKEVQDKRLDDKKKYPPEKAKNKENLFKILDSRNKEKT
jgi:hypothetical protein